MQRSTFVISPSGGYGVSMENHKHKNKKPVLNRLSRAIGHLNAVKTMVEEDRDCSQVLIQLSAIKSEIVNISKVILKEHIEHCVVDAINCGDEETMNELMKAIDKIS